LDYVGARVERADDIHLLTREFSRCRLIAQCIGVVVHVIQNKHRAMRIHAGQRTHGVTGSHSHLGMVGFRAYAVGYGPSEGLFLRGRDCHHGKNDYDKTAADEGTRHTAHRFHSKPRKTSSFASLDRLLEVIWKAFLRFPQDFDHSPAIRK
jgi:hypothetical protein